MTYPDFIVCAKCGAKWSTKDELIKRGKCLICGHLLKEEYRDKKYKPKFSTQYHLKPELPYTCTTIKRPCTITPPYGNFGGCIGCTYREPIREPKGVNHECNESTMS